MPSDRIPSTIDCQKRGRIRGPRGGTEHHTEHTFGCQYPFFEGKDVVRRAKDPHMSDLPPDPADVPTTRVTTVPDDRTERIDAVLPDPSEGPPPPAGRPGFGGGWLILLGLLAVALAVGVILLATGAFKSD